MRGDKVKKNIFLISPEELMAEVGDFKESEEAPPDKATADESKAAAELLVFLEDDLGVDTSRLYIRVKGGHVYMQGTVDSEDLLREIKEMLVQKPEVLELERRLRVQS